MSENRIDIENFDQCTNVNFHHEPDSVNRTNKQQEQKKNHICTVICPSLEFLNKVEIITNVVCSVENCDEVFSHQSALNLHLEKVHRLKTQKNEKDELILTRAMSKSQKELENCACKYHCPIVSCKYHLNENRSLPTFHSLKNHFIRIHGCKKFKCSKCFKLFSIKSEMERHELGCGKLFKCTKCGCFYSTLASLNKHIKKKGHLSEKLVKDLQNEIVEVKKEACKRTGPVFILPNNSIILLPFNNSQHQTNPDSFNGSLKSLGCQTNSDLFNRTQETGSQTCLRNFNVIEQDTSTQTFQNLSNHFESSLELLDTLPEEAYPPITTQETQTNKVCVNTISTSTNMELNNNSDYDCLDAATSTSPFLDLNAIFSNTSTQTTQSFCANNTYDDNILNSDQSYFCSDLNNFSQDFFYQNKTIDKTSQTNRCITPAPSNVCSYACQTDDLYIYSDFSPQNNQNNFSQSTHNSIQTQTYYKDIYHVVETQTEWNFDPLENYK